MSSVSDHARKILALPNGKITHEHAREIVRVDAEREAATSQAIKHAEAILHRDPYASNRRDAKAILALLRGEPGEPPA